MGVHEIIHHRNQRLGGEAVRAGQDEKRRKGERKKGVNSDNLSRRGVQGRLVTATMDPATSSRLGLYAGTEVPARQV